MRSVRAYGVYLAPSACHAIRLSSGLKKAKTLPPLSSTLSHPKEPRAVCLELDELWSFVRRKTNKRWVWLALCRHTRQVVACVVGGRGIATCRQLWQAVPAIFRQGVCFTDFWDAYQAVIPDELHQAVGKETSLTNHVERFNNTLRQRTGPEGAVLSKTTPCSFCP